MKEGIPGIYLLSRYMFLRIGLALIQITHYSNAKRKALYSKNMNKYILLLIISIYSIYSVPVLAQNSKPKIENTPSWVNVINTPKGRETVSGNGSQNTEHLLIDRQDHTGVGEEFYHLARRILNEASVEENGTLTVTFDPTYQELVFHKVDLIRDGEKINCLDPSTIQVIQPERSLENNLYTGDLSAIIFLDDLRVGDVLEYSLTLRGSNPLLAGHYWNHFGLGWSTHVEKQYYRIVWESGKNLRWRTHGLELRPQILKEKKATEYIWELGPQPAIDIEDQIPFAYEPYPYLEASSFASWSEVVEWALPLYPMKQNLISQAMSRKLEQWKAQYTSYEERVLHTIQFIQDKVRYLGIEIGPNSHRPTPPSETYNRRYGDCKDKSYLLCVLLGDLGIKAWPVLVNQTLRGGTAHHLPSPFVFNHAIVVFQLAGETYWIDPTLSSQGGTLRSRYLPEYALGLVIRPGVQSLEAIPSPTLDKPLTEVHDEFRLKDYESAVSFSITTTYRTSAADHMRATLAEVDHKVLATDFVNFYTRIYPSIRVKSPLKINDNRQANVIEIIESYEIDTFWKEDTEQRRMVASFFPVSIDSALPQPNRRIRKMPLALSYPAWCVHQTQVYLPEHWDIDDASKSIRDAAFSLQCEHRYHNNQVRFRYEYRTHTNEVPPERASTFFARLNEAKDQLGDTLYRPTSAGLGSLNSIHWIFVILFTCYGLLLLVIAIWLIRSPRFKRRNEEGMMLPDEGQEKPRLCGLRGWLILVGIGVVISPLLQTFSFVLNIRAYFSLDVWHNVAVPSGADYHPLFGPLLMIEMLGNQTLIVMSFLTLYLYFAKRSLFPKVYIICSLFTFIFILTDIILSKQIPMIAENPDTGQAREIARAFWRCVIWCPYMLRSRRVRATFVN